MGPDYYKHPIYLLYWAVLEKKYNLLEWNAIIKNYIAAEHNIPIKEMIKFIDQYSLKKE